MKTKTMKNPKPNMGSEVKGSTPKSYTRVTQMGEKSTIKAAPFLVGKEINGGKR